MSIHTGTLGKANKYGAGDKKMMMGRCWDDWITREFSGNIFSSNKKRGIQSDCCEFVQVTANATLCRQRWKNMQTTVCQHMLAQIMLPIHFGSWEKGRRGEAFCVLLIMHDFWYSRNIQFASPTEYFIHCAQQQISAPLVWKWFSLQRLFRAQGFPGGSAPYMNRRLGGIAKDFSLFFVCGSI